MHPRVQCVRLCQLQILLYLQRWRCAAKRQKNGYPCEEAIDSIICDKDNGLLCLWKENAPLWVTFELEAPGTFNTIIIQNGAGRQDHKINAFKLRVKRSSLNSWQNLFEDFKVERDVSAKVTQDGSVTLSRGQEYLQITFKPVLGVTAILIELIQAKDKSAIINEILIPRKSKYFCCIPIIIHSGWHESTKTFRSSICKSIGHFPRLNLAECKAQCLKNQQCTAFNFAHSPLALDDCSLKNCPLPIEAPTERDYPAYSGYYQKGRLFCRLFR